jgi:hypothetical protein
MTFMTFMTQGSLTISFIFMTFMTFMTLTFVRLGVHRRGPDVLIDLSKLLCGLQSRLGVDHVTDSIDLPDAICSIGIAN